MTNRNQANVSDYLSYNPFEKDMGLSTSTSRAEIKNIKLNEFKQDLVNIIKIKDH